MKMPVVRGVIDRRILVNYRVDPAILTSLLPEPFRPKQVGGCALAGICLIRLRNVRPACSPFRFGISSENAAHRVAVEWDEAGTVREGVYIWRRDTSLRFNVLAGGRIFPGVHHLARFSVEETPERLHVALQSDDEATRISFLGRRTDKWPGSSVFESPQDASEFFRAGSVGYSPARDAGRFEGLELRCQNWSAEPLEIESVQSSFFDDRSLFPVGTLALDGALLMRGIDHEWRSRGVLAAPDERDHSNAEFCRSVAG